ncbi:hypothetical protein KHA80_13120 [Anaerobacillus sp. HL2]|nr:hypothetical protein KHA80_13120 [Anaerobacillus sp. HL2]
MNDVLDIPEGQSLVKVEILTNLQQENLKDKETKLDVRARVVGLGISM